MHKHTLTDNGEYFFNSDNISSDSSGNHSENDELNILRKFKRKLGESNNLKSVMKETSPTHI